MKQAHVRSFSEFHELLDKNFEYGAIFRGVPNESYELIPRVGRQLPYYESIGADKARLLEDERQAFDVFCEEGAGLFPQFATAAIDRLVLAQHHGLPTRLLDWTLNPLVALYFASNAESKAAGAVYALAKTKQSMSWSSEAAIGDPLATTQLCGYFPKHVSPRVTGQRGLVTVHSDPTEPFDSIDLTKIIMDRDEKNRCLKTLKWYGVAEHTLFPGLDGLARFISGTTFLNAGPL